MFLKKVATIISLALLICSCNKVEPLTDEYKRSTISKLNKHITNYYVDEAVAKTTVNHLNSLLDNGSFKKIDSLNEFIDKITSEVQLINKDKHFFARKNSTKKKKVNRKQSDSEVLENNIGYMYLKSFREDKYVIKVMVETVENCEAIIIDLRDNLGGGLENVQQLSSYFFNEKIQLNSLYWRDGNRTQEFWTFDVSNKKVVNKPLYILTSSKTVSAAEDFVYTFKVRNRALVVGEKTFGATNPGRTFKINDEISAFIPMRRSINPVTKSNWEGGVKPDILVEESTALEKTIALIKERFN